MRLPNAALITSFAVAAVLLGPQTAAAQTQPAPTGVLDKPCAALAPMPVEVGAYLAEAAKARAAHQPEPAASAQGRALYDAWQNLRLTQDFAGLCHYADQNAALPPATDRRVVFFGDSITELWDRLDPSLFTHDVINRGISGQTTAQMVGRFQEDVIALHPRAVLILAGTNDIAGNTGPTTLTWIEANIRTMAQAAKANHVRVVLASVLPAARYSWRPALEPVPQIHALNDWMAAYAKAQRLIFLDYRPPLDDGHAGFKTELSPDGVHPNAKGYALMRPLAERAMREALSRKAP
jgi:lysophospholipase L1-like esterase